MCATFLLACSTHAATGEAIPILPCISLCTRYWDNQYCGGTTQLYYSYILLPAGQSAIDSAFPFCGDDARFLQEPFPPDRYGVGRVIPNTLPYAEGLKGNLIYPDATHTYTLSATGENLTLPCREVSPFSDGLLSTAAPCKFPLTTLNDVCVVSCPLPILEEADARISITAFVVPGSFALALCLFVFFDSLWLIFESKGGDIGALLLREGGHAAYNTDAQNKAFQSMMMRSGQSPPPPLIKRTPLRASTLYSLLGSVLGIVYFIVGPLPSLLKGHEVSCAKKGQTIDFGALINATDATRDV